MTFAWRLKDLEADMKSRFKIFTSSQISRTPFCLLPRRLLPLDLDLLLDFGLFVKLVEVVDDDRNREGDAKHAADRAGWKI